MAALLNQDQKLRAWVINFPKPGVEDKVIFRNARVAADQFLASHDRLISAMRAELQEHQKMKAHPLITRWLLAVKRFGARIRRLSR